MVCGASKASDQPAHMHSLIRAFASRCVKLLTEHRLEFVSLKGGCSGSSESILVKMQLCRGSIYDILASSRLLRYAGYIHISKNMKNSDKYHKSSFSCMQCTVSCSSSLKLFFFYFMQTHEKETQLGNYVLCAKSAFVRQSHHVLPES